MAAQAAACDVAIDDGRAGDPEGNGVSRAGHECDIENYGRMNSRRGTLGFGVELGGQLLHRTKRLCTVATRGSSNGRREQSRCNDRT